MSNIEYNDDYRNIIANYDVKKNISNARITRYDKAEIISTRISQIENGAPPLIKIESDEQLNVKEIVEREYNEGVIPFIIKRKIGDDHVEYWKFRDLIRD